MHQSPQSNRRLHNAYPSLLSVASTHWNLLGRTAHTNPRSHTNCSIVPLRSPAITRWPRSYRGKSHRVLTNNILLFSSLLFNSNFDSRGSDYPDKKDEGVKSRQNKLLQLPYRLYREICLVQLILDCNTVLALLY